MEVAAEELENRQAALTVEVDDDWLHPFLKTASRRLAARVAIPGFRKGKAPYGVILRHMGREALIREVIDELGTAAYDEALERSGLEPIQLDDLEIADWEPLTLNMTVSLKPTVDLGDYQSRPVEMVEVKVEEDDVEGVLTDLQERYAEKVPVERPAELGDFAVIDIEGTLQGRVALQMDQQECELRSDGEFLAADFAENLIGMSVDEERSFSVTFSEDHEDEELAGQEVALRVRLHSLHEKRLPEIDDDLARMVGGLADLEELRRKIGHDLHSRREAEQKDELADELLDSMAAEVAVDYPPVFLDTELQARIRMLAIELQEQGFTLEGYLSATGKTIEDLLAEYRPAAEKRVKKSLILAELVEREGIEVQDEETEEELVRITEVYGQDTKALRDALLSNEQVREDIRNRLCGRKIVELLAELPREAEGEEARDDSFSAEGRETPVASDEESVSQEDSASG